MRNSFKYAARLAWILALTISAQKTWAQANTNNGGTPAAGGPRLYGEFLLTSNYIEEGYSASNSSFAMQPELGYSWPSARVGIWGSNVQYPTNGESLNLRPFGWYNYVFTPGIELKARFDMSMFFASNARNANIFTFDLNAYTHHGVIKQTSNWYGTGSSALWLAYYKSWPAFWSFDYKLQVGYNMVNAKGFDSYFAVYTGLTYKTQDLFYDLFISYNASGSQFKNSTGDPVALFDFGAKF